MRLRRFRIRTLMIAVVAVAAVLAVVASIDHRRRTFLSMAEQHAAAAGPFRYYFSWGLPAGVAWHMEMEGKYRAAACRPWLPVAPDPPEPKGLRSELLTL